MPEYSKLFVTLMGVGTVFFGLICIIVLVTIMGKLFRTKAAPAPAAASGASVNANAAAAPVNNVAKQQEIIAAITAAILEDLGPNATNLRITDIKKI